MVRCAAVLRLAALITFPVIGLEQIAHTSGAALAAYPLYQALHWFSDSLLALPLAVIAVWTGGLIAKRPHSGRGDFADTLLHAAVIALAFALLLVPGAVLHEEADRLTHAHASLSIHAHGASDLKASGSAPLAFEYVTHALSDGVEGQVVGLPIALLALLVMSRGRRRVVLGSNAVRGRDGPVAANSRVTARLGGERR